MKKILYPVILLVIAFYSCNTHSPKPAKASLIPPEEETTSKKESVVFDSTYDPIRGEGRFTNVKVTASLNTAMAENGEKIYKARCESCHDLSDAKRVGPGLRGITKRHTAEWFMNFMTNTDVMLDKDPYAQEQLKKYKIRMSNQYLADAENRDTYEFMRKNDGAK
jgi:cytochrome c2